MVICYDQKLVIGFTDNDAGAASCLLFGILVISTVEPVIEVIKITVAACLECTGD